MIKKIVPFCMVLVSFFSTDVLAEKESFVTIGSGGIKGVYYPTGAAICGLFNKTSNKHGFKCSVESTGGSVYNLRHIRSGDLDMGIAQSDWQFHSFNGSSKFEKDGAFENLRAIFSVHSEPFTVIARKGSGIKTLADLQGKRVNIGNMGSGQRGTLEVVMDAMGWDNSVFRQVFVLKASKQGKALCADTFDAAVYTVGHPSSSVAEASDTCDVQIVTVDGDKIEKLVSDNDYYREATVPGGMYRGTDEDTKTFGVGATFVTSENVPNDVIYNVVKAVFTNFKEFKKQHPAFEHLKKEEMVKDGLSAPLHPGAIKYYKEAGLL